MRTKLSRSGLLLASLALTACAHQHSQHTDTDTPDQEQRGEAVRSLCFARSISGFELLDDERLIIRKGRRKYELQMHGGCPELRFAQHLGVDSFGSCLSRGDRILAFPYGISPQDWRPPSCLIDAIYEWLPAKDEQAPASEDIDATH